MLRMVAARLFHAVLVLMGVTLVVASLVKVVPGDPVDVIAAGNPGMTLEDMSRLREEMGLTRPVSEQFLIYLTSAVRGDLGVSIRQGVPTAELIWERLPATLELAFWAILLAIMLAVPLGIVTSLRRNSALDYAGTFVAVLGVSVPGFLVGVLTILLFSVQLGWLPASGFRGSALVAGGQALAQWDGSIFWAAARHYILPAVSLALVLVAINTRLIRSSMLEVLQQDFVTFATAKGVPRPVVILRHAFRNALLPVVTAVGLQLGTLLSGTIVVETVFAWPGIGRLAVDAIHWRDYPVIQAVVLVSAVLFIGLNLLIDLFYRVIDPRLRHD